MILEIAVVIASLDLLSLKTSIYLEFICTYDCNNGLGKCRFYLLCSRLSARHLKAFRITIAACQARRKAGAIDICFQAHSSQNLSSVNAVFRSFQLSKFNELRTSWAMQVRTAARGKAMFSSGKPLSPWTVCGVRHARSSSCVAAGVRRTATASHR